jgi:DNA-binding beta-propeller fold protein YncE
MRDKARTVLRLASIIGLLACVVAWAITGFDFVGDSSPDGRRLAEVDARFSSGTLALRDPFVRASSPAAGRRRGRPGDAHAIAARERSRTEFAHLDAARAARVARQAFPAQVARRTAVLPSVPPRARITRFLSPRAAQLALPGGKRVAIQSMRPMAVETSPGHDSPVDLAVVSKRSGYGPARPAAGADVVIPRHAADGIALPQLGISLTPVNTAGSATRGAEAQIDGASVIYANTQQDTDTVVKPTIDGVDAISILRSVNSPERLYFRMSIPVGARLEQPDPDTGAARVVDRGRTVAVVRPPVATDAAGSAVPVSMRVRGHLLELSLNPQAGDYQWPIAVDPEVVDEAFGPSECHREGEPERRSSNWCVAAGQPVNQVLESKEGGTGSSEFKHNWFTNAVELWNETTLSAGAYTVVAYHTQGASRIYKAELWSAGSVASGRAKLEMAHRSGAEEGAIEASTLIAEGKSWALTKTEICPVAGCPTTGGNEGNLAAFKLEAKEPGGAFGLSATVQQGFVYISQEQGPEASFNEEQSELEVEPGVKRLNVLYKAQYFTEHAEASRDPWLGPYSNTAVELKAHDPGVGIAWGLVSFGGFLLEEPIYESGKCNGVQCNESYHTALTYNQSMPEGEPTLKWVAADLAGRIPNCPSCLGMRTEDTQIIRVDAKPPSKVEVSGLPANAELSAAPHNLTLSARDEGPAGARSSGVQSIAVSVDGGTFSTVPGAWCTQGPCTASGKYTLAAETLTEGVHRLIVTATDNAGNPSGKEFTFDVRHGSPIAAGPGAVDPTTGQFKMSATDVSLAGAGAVSRAYQSRSTSAAAEGPLGSQWALSIGAGEGLTVLPNAGVVLKSPSGGTTTFTRNEGKFESPLGDGSVKLEAKEAEPGKGISEYTLSDAKAGITTAFTQPSGTSSTTPLYASQFSAEGSGAIAPVNDAVDAEGDVWVTDQAGNRVLKFSPAGALLGAYGSYGSAMGQFNSPWGIAVNPSTGSVYVGDEHNNRVVQLSSTGQFVAAYGWGVGNNSSGGFERCTAGCKAGTAGGASGEFNLPLGVAVDANGNVWVADDLNARVEEFNEKEVLLTFGAEGTAGGQFKEPTAIAFSGGNVYVADGANNRIQELTTAGTFVKAFGWGVSDGQGKAETCTTGCKAGIAGGGNEQFNLPRQITTEPATGNIYVAESANNRVQELTAAGKVVTKFGAVGSGGGQMKSPTGVAVGSTQNIYVADNGNARLQEWMRPTWFPARTEGPLKTVTSAYAYAPVEVEGKTVIEPTEMLAPVPVGVSCLGEHGEVEAKYLKKGCRALTFTYASGTTATGTGPSQWGEMKGNLAQIKFHGWDPAKGAMSEPAVAEYAYDNKGQLRAEWDPRISSPLKTVYGYDEEGHLTAVSPPGQEPWLMRYGALFSDPNNGRLLSVTRPAAASATVLKEQKATGAPSNTAAPTLSSTTPKVGTTLNVSGNGTWTNTPLAYSYQWYDCETTTPSSSTCAAIAGATNSSFTPQISDAGYFLIAKVAATNATATIQASTAASGAITTFAPTLAKTFGGKGAGKGQINYEEQDAIDAKGDVWVTDYLGDRLEEFSSEGTFIKAVGYGVVDGKAEFETCTNTTTCVTGLAGTGHGQFSGPFGIAINKATGNIYVTDQNLRVQVLDENGKYASEFGGPGSQPGQFGSELAGLAVDKNGDIWVADFSNNRVQEFSPAGAFLTTFGEAGKGNGQFERPVALAVSGEHVYVVDYKNNRVQEFTTSGSWLRTWGKEGAGQGEFLRPYAIDVEPVSGDLYVTDNGHNRVQAFSPTGQFIMLFGSSEQLSGPTGLAFDATGRAFVGDNGNGRVERWDPQYSLNNPLPGAPASESKSITTFEYRVPLSVLGRQALTAAEIAKWGQTDAPADGEAIAVLPPDRPQGWPGGYVGATIYYMDEHGRTVNISAPSGAISTTEYNEANETVRTLSADNRAAAMKEGCVSVEKHECKSAALAEKLDTRTEYSPDRTQIVKVLGPEHKIKLAGGAEVEARAVTRDYYNNGAKEAEEQNQETYNLVTSSTTAALLANGEEKDQRETVNSYSGQNNLGWKLRKPTSTTIDPNGLDLTTATVYQELTNGEGKKEATGNIEETKPPAVMSAAKLSFAAPFASKGAGAGQVNGPDEDAVDGGGNVWVADNANNRVDVFSASGGFVEALGWGVVDGKSELEACTSSCVAGLEGGGAGEFKHPWGIATNRSAGDVYVSDQTNNRVEEFEVATGKWLRSFGEFGKGGGQFNSPNGVAVDGSGNVWVADYGFNRIQEFSSTGAFVKAVGWGVANGEAKLQTCTTGCKEGLEGSGEGEFKGPKAIAFDATGRIYVTDFNNNRVEVFSASGESVVGTFGSTGAGNGQFSGPATIAVDPNTGNVLVSDQGNNRVEEFSPSRSYIGQFGTSGTGNGQFTKAQGIAINNSSYAYITDLGNNRIQQWAPPGSVRNLSYRSASASKGAGAGQVNGPDEDAVDGGGNVWVADNANNRVDVFSASGGFVEALGWGVVDGKSELEACTSSCVAGLEGGGAGEFKHPWGIATNRSAGDVYVSDQTNNRVEEFEVATGKWLRSFGEFGKGGGQFNSPNGVAVDGSGNVWVADYGFNRIQEFSSTGAFVKAVGWGVANGEAKLQTCTTGCKEGLEGSGEGEFKGPKAIAFDATGRIYVTDFNNNRVEVFSASGESVVGTFGSTGAGNGQFSGPATIAVDPNTGNVLVSDQGNNRVEEFSPSRSYIGQFGTSGTGNGQFTKAQGIAINNSSYAYITDLGNNRIQQWAPASNGNLQAHETRTIYYSAGANPETKNCGEHPEWANLPCETTPVGQPQTAGLATLPVSTFSYNVWDETEATVEQFINAEGKEEKREKLQGYDAAGRAQTSEEKANPVGDAALPQVTNEYNGESGVLEKQSASINGSNKATTSKTNTLGQQIEYIDAEGNVAKYTYEVGGDGRLTEVNEGKGKEAESKQTLTYNATSGLVEKLVATDANMTAAQGTFKASYDVEGNMTSETYPNGMCANTAYNSEGKATSIEYLKPKTCTENKTVWFSDTVVPSVHGETLEQSSTLAKERYTYDAAGRLTEAQETPAGKGCRSRIYGYDEESNRLSETKRESSTETCPAEGGVIQTHSYDVANRLTDPSVEYESFGNATKMPAADAEHEIISTFYVDGQVASEKQNEQLLKYVYDPAGRTMETVAENEKTKTKATTISHYADSGSTVTWTGEGTEKWSRNIPGIDGALDATQQAGGPPTLQLHDLLGNAVATVGDSEAETKLLTTYNSTEFGVPNEGKTPPKYAWLGALGVATEPSEASGASTEAGATFVPQVARALQTAPVTPPGAFPDGQGTGEQFGADIPGWYLSLSSAESAASLAEYTAQQEAAAREAEYAVAEVSEELRESMEGAEAANAVAEAAGLGANLKRLSYAAEVVSRCDYLRAYDRHNPRNDYYFNKQTYAWCQSFYHSYGDDVYTLVKRGLYKIFGNDDVTFHVPSAKDVGCTIFGAGVAIATDGGSLLINVVTGAGTGLACAAIGGK